MKITANCKIKEKINNRLIQKQALSCIKAQIVNGTTIIGNSFSETLAHRFN